MENVKGLCFGGYRKFWPVPAGCVDGKWILKEV